MLNNEFIMTCSFIIQHLYDTSFNELVKFNYQKHDFLHETKASRVIIIKQTKVLTTKIGSLKKN